MTIRALLIRSRPRFWLYLAGPVIVGAVFGAETLSALLATGSILLFAYFLLPANLFLYGINDVFDAAIDRENPKKSGRERRYEGDRLTWVAVAASAILGIGLLAFLPPAAAPWIVGFLFLGTAYSAPPFRLKTRPPLDSLSNGLYVLPGVAAYAALAGSAPPALAILGGWLWTMAMHTFSAIPDIEPDRAAGIETTATQLGTTLSVAYCGLLWLLASGVFALLNRWLGALLLLYPVLLGGLWLRDVELDRAYWWYPAINTVAGMMFTLGGLWGLYYG